MPHVVPTNLKGSYADLSAANPYANSVVNQTAWDRFINTLGLRSRYDDYEAQRMQAMNEYDAQLSQLQFENEYNSAAAQAERERLAGLNPNLTGNISAGEAGGFDQTQSSPAAVMADAENFSSKIMEVFQFGLSLATGIQGFQSADLAKKFNIQQLAEQDAMNMFFNIPGFSGFNDDTSVNVDLSKWSPEAIYSFKNIVGDDAYHKLANEGKVNFDSLNQFSDFYLLGKKNKKRYFMSPSDNRYYNSHRKGYLSSPAFRRDFWQAIRDTKQAKQIADMTYGRPYSDNMVEILDSDVFKKLSDYGEKYLQYQNAMMAGSAAEAGYTRDYYNNLDGARAAAAMNSGNELTDEQKTAQKQLLDAQSDIISYFSDLRSDPKAPWYDHLMGNVALLMLSMFSNGGSMFNPMSVSMPHFNVSGGPKGTSWGISR